MTVTPWIRRLLAAVLLLTLVTPPALAQTVQRVVSPGGITAWLIESHNAPILSLQVAFPGGAALDPEGKAGLAHLVSGLLDEGAGDMPSLAFRQALEDRAIRLSFHADYDWFYGSLRTLVSRREEAVDLMALALSAPRFDAEPVTRIRDQVLSGLKEDERDPRTVARNALQAHLFPDHPYGRPREGTPESVAAITPTDMRRFVNDRLVRQGMLVGVAGDISAEALAPLLDRLFADLPARGTPADIPPVTPRADGSLTVITRQVPQTTALFAQPGLSRTDPDYYAAQLVAQVLGGQGFGTRLMQEVREKRGLAYGAYAYLLPRRTAPLLLGTVATRNDALGKSLEVIREQWRDLAENGPSAEELANAKAMVTGSFRLSLDSTQALARVLVTMQRYDLGRDYLSRRDALFNTITLPEARLVARDLLTPARLTTVAVGQPTGLEDTAADLE